MISNRKKMNSRLSEVQFTDQFPRLNTTECIAVLSAVVLSPFWFITFFGINLGPADALLVFAFMSYFYRTRTMPVVPSRLTVLGVGMFLIAGLIGVVISPVPIKGMLDYLQYLYIFLVAVPIAFAAFSEDRTRAYAFLALLITLNTLIIVTIVIGVITGEEFSDLVLWYGNQNQLYWLVASGFVLNICLAADGLFPWLWRMTSLLLATAALISVVLGLTLTAVLIIGGGAWLVLAWYLTRNKTRSARYGYPFGIISAILAVGGIAFIALNWEFVYTQGSLYARIPQYRAAFSTAIEAFPLGTGMASEEIVLTSIPDSRPRSVHNYFLSYLIQIGLLGSIGFTLMLVAWLRSVFLTAYLRGQRAFEFAPVAIFAMYIIVIFLQPVPVRRYWWLVFALSWGTYHSESNNLWSPTPLTHWIKRSIAHLRE